MSAIRQSDQHPGGAVILTASGLRYSYAGALAVRDVSMEIREGEIVALIGSNGAGKSTTVQMIAGALRPESGRIDFAGRDQTGWPCHRNVNAGITLVPEGRLVFPQMSVHENLLMGAVSERAGQPEEMLEEVFQLFPRLAERRRQLAGLMSGGEQQMLAIARGLMARPRLMMLDEPSLGLMPTLVADLFRLIRTLNERGLSILLVEQNVRQSLMIADRAYVLDKGTVATSGAGRDLLESDFIRKTYLGL